MRSFLSNLSFTMALKNPSFRGEILSADMFTPFSFRFTMAFILLLILLPFFRSCLSCIRSLFVRKLAVFTSNVSTLLLFKNSLNIPMFIMG